MFGAKPAPSEAPVRAAAERRPTGRGLSGEKTRSYRLAGGGEIGFRGKAANCRQSRSLEGRSWAQTIGRHAEQSGLKEGDSTRQSVEADV